MDFIKMISSEFNLAEKVAKLSIDCYNSLPKTGKPNKNEWTVLSTILQETIEIESNNFEVVALGTGTKCLGKNQLSDTGELINDSHAEIICRRAFLRYIYNEMQSNKESLLKFDKQKFSFSENCKFHFFTTYMPCGDASLFDENVENDCGDVLTAPDEDANVPEKRSKLDPHLTGAKCLPEDSESDSKSSRGRCYKLGAIRTKPGKGDPTLSVSCSDKLSKWAHLGIQGSLLSLLLQEPIYLSSITVGNKMYSEKSLKRALYQRFPRESGQSHKRFPLIIPKLFQYTNIEFEFKRSDLKQPCPSSIIFCKNCSLEVSVEGRKQGVTKKNRGSPKGRLKICKLEFLHSFLEISKQRALNFSESISYLDLKQSSDYFQAKVDLEKLVFRIWPEKPANLQKFRAKTQLL